MIIWCRHFIVLYIHFYMYFHCILNSVLFVLSFIAKSHPCILFILRPTTGQVQHKVFFKVGPDAGQQPTRVQQNPKITSAPTPGNKTANNW